MNIMLKFSQLNGLIGDIFNGIGNFFQNLFQLIFMIIFVFLYNAFIVPIALTMDAVQLVFRKFAGLDTYVFEGDVQSGDIVLSLINNQTVQNVFWSLLILAVVLLIITTIVAIIKAQTQSSDDKGRKTNSQILVTSVKALINFFMVPVVAILGIFMGNALLKSLDKATGGGDGVKVSSMLFVSCAYECNRARTSTTFATDLANGYNDMGVLKGTPENIADVVDQAFKNGTSFEPKSFDYSKGPSNLFSDVSNDYFYFYVMQIYSAGVSNIQRSSFNVYHMWQVFYYYDLTSFNYIMFIVASVFVLWVLLTTSIGLIKRMFKIVILLVVSPPIAALMPLEGGKALGTWRSEFIGSTLSAYSTIVAFNLTMMLLGPISEIKFFYIPGDSTAVAAGVSVFSVFNLIIQILIICGALIFFKSFTTTISKMIGAENAYDEGVGAAKTIASKVAMVATAGAAAAGAKAASKSAKLLKEAGKGKKSLLDKASHDREVAENNYRAVRNKADNDPEKIKAKNALEDAQKAEAGAKGAYDKNEESIKAYEELAQKRLHTVRDNTLSVATNGLSDGFIKGLGSIKNDKLKTKSARKKERDKFNGIKTAQKAQIKKQAQIDEKNRQAAYDLAVNMDRQALKNKRSTEANTLDQKKSSMWSSEIDKVEHDKQITELALKERQSIDASDLAKTNNVDSLRNMKSKYKKELKQKDLSKEQREDAQYNYDVSTQAVKKRKKIDKNQAPIQRD